MQNASFHSVRSVIPGITLLTAIVGTAFAINRVWSAASPLTVSVLLGFLVSNLLGWPSAAARGNAFAAKHLLRAGIALLGFELSLSAIADLGVRGVLAIALVVSVTVLGVPLIGKALGVSPELSLLVGVGYGICGASAIAAAKPQTKATEQEASYAIGLVALFGSLSIFVLPTLGAALGLSDIAFGTWAGSAVHDVGQVVATASVRGDIALQQAVIVKLARVAMLAPVVLMLALRHRREVLHATAERPPLLPGFVIAFLAFAAIGSTGLVAQHAVDSIVFVSKVLIAFGLAALGVNVRWRALRAVGGRPLLLGVVAWALVATTGLIATLITR